MRDIDRWAELVLAIIGAWVVAGFAATVLWVALVRRRRRRT